MFGKGKAAVSGNNKHDSTTLISAETTITGDINFTGAVHIEGQVKGNISSEHGEHGEHGLLTIAHGGSVEGDVRAQRVVIDGQVRGNVFAEEHLELAARSVITGNVFYSVIEMTKGAQINGSLEHRPDGIPVGPQPLLERSDVADAEIPVGEVIDAENN